MNLGQHVRLQHGSLCAYPAKIAHAVSYRFGSDQRIENDASSDKSGRDRMSHGVGREMPSAMTRQIIRDNSVADLMIQRMKGTEDEASRHQHPGKGRKQGEMKENGAQNAESFDRRDQSGNEYERVAKEISQVTVDLIVREIAA